MKKRTYKDFEDFLDGEETSLSEEEIQNERGFKETRELFALLDGLPRGRAPRGFERNLYVQIGISYIPVYRKVLILTGMVIFSSLLYLFGRVAYTSLSAKMSVSHISQFFSELSVKVSQFITLMRVGHHLKDILFAFTNPWLFVGLAFISSSLMMILILVAREVRRKAIVLVRF
jgi:hypothetical protein